MFHWKEELNKLLTKSGVYIFKNNSGQILYIGKATNLRSRVGSYFQGRDERGVRIASMVSQIADIKVQETDSVLEALILEYNLIKKLQPKYNIERKDDKSFSYVTISKETYPRIEIVRESDLYKKHKTQITNHKQIPKPKNQNPNKILPTTNYQLQTIFGPYTSKKQLEIALKIIRKIFPYHSDKQKTEKGCFDFQLGRCPGPYAGAISKGDYAQNIRGIRMILEGKKKSLLKKLKKEMQELSNHRQY